MILSVRFEVGADTAGQVVVLLDYCTTRLGLPPGETQDVIESVRTDEVFGYKGRRKTTYEVPLNAAEEREWRGGGGWPFEARSGIVPGEVGYDEELKLNPDELADRLGLAASDVREFLSDELGHEEEYVTPFLIERVQEHFLGA